MSDSNTSRPLNILLINCDDLGYGDLGCYGSTVNETPALDRLASEGTRFTEFYMASSICSPSRAGMMTGCYPQRISMNRVLFPADAEGLNPEEETIAGMLKGAGYRTALVGKWHLGDQPEFLPRQHGFDHYYGIPFSNDMGRQIGDPEDKAPLPLVCDDEVIEEQPDQSGITARYVEEAVRFMRESREADKPFFLYFAHMYVHLPLYVPDRFMKESKNGRYGAAVACIDWAWDRLDRELQRLGLSDNTVVIFTSDNGSRARGEGGSNGPLRGTKFTTWEGGFRLPLMMRWPGKIPAGRVRDDLIASMDFLPTLAAWAGIQPSGKHEIDGLDVSGLVQGDDDSSPRDEMAYFSNGNLAAFRKGKWKLHFARREGWKDPYTPMQELYDLADDPGESRNVYDRHPEVVWELTEAADAYRARLGDAFTGCEGTAVRPCGRKENPVALTAYDPAYPYVVAEYDLADRG